MKVLPIVYELKVYLIDNNSEYIEFNNLCKGIKKYNLTFIRNKINAGFAGGNNLGIKYAINDKCDYVLLLNNDTIIINDIIGTFINTILRNPDYGILGLVNYYYKNPVRIWQDGIILNKLTGGTKHPRKLNKDLIDCDYVPGSSIFINVRIIEEIGLLDENYFAYSEEADFCVRAKKKVGKSVL